MPSRNILRTFALLGLALCCGQVAAGDKAAPSIAATTLDSLIHERMNEAGITGLAAAIVVDRKVVWSQGYGFADRQQGRAFTPRTIMNIGSISKVFTGVALMRAVQEGKVSLDADINAYLPFKVTHPLFPAEPITLRQLATHTSGITDRWSVYERAYHYGGDSPEPLGQFLKNYFALGGKTYSRENFLDARPGTHREYSNIAAALAGHVVEQAVGEPLNVYTRRTIFEPLQMKDTGWFLSEIAMDKHSKLYIAQGQTSPIELYGLTTYPDGGVRTSVADLSRLFIALLDGGEFEGTRILESEHAAEMLRFQYTAADKPDNVNIEGEDSVNSGIFWASKFDVTRIGHNGSDPGVMTMMLSDPEREVGVILCVNTSLSEQDSKYHAAIFDALWTHAEAMKLADARAE